MLAVLLPAACLARVGGGSRAFLAASSAFIFFSSSAEELSQSSIQRSRPYGTHLRKVREAKSVSELLYGTLSFPFQNQLHHRNDFHSDYYPFRPLRVPPFFFPIFKLGWGHALYHDSVHYWQVGMLPPIWSHGPWSILNFFSSGSERNLNPHGVSIVSVRDESRPVRSALRLFDCVIEPTKVHFLLHNGVVVSEECPMLTR